MSFVPVRSAIPAVPVVAHSPQQRSEVFLAASLLLDYPGEDWSQILDQVGELAPTWPGTVGAEFSQFVSWAKRVGQTQVEQHYVETFDQKRRCCLELTYYATGDTRQRGIALTVFQDLYRAVGWEITGKHLPDFLPYILELAARCEGESGELVLDAIASHREGIEVLHAALTDLNSPWSHVVSALRMALPEVDEATKDRMQQLIRKGPPAELVGINDYTNLPWPSQAGKSTEFFMSSPTTTTEGEPK